VGSRALFAGAPSGRVDIYDSATGAWTTAALSVPRSEATGHTLGMRALFVGGVAGPPPRSHSDPMGIFTSDRVDLFEAPGPP
jgi:hypothetical protein